MRLRFLASLFALVVGAATARAQSGVYAMFDAQQFTRSGLLAAPVGGQSNTESPWLYGTTFGAFYTVHRIPKLGELHTGPLAIGFDARGTIVRTNTQLNRDDGILSLRVTTKNPFARVKPYVQGGAGVGHTKVPGQLSFTNNWSYLFAVGADRTIHKHLDWRVVEVSGGFLGSYTSGSNVNNSNRLLNLATGLVATF
ncbi:MAG: hypothetical protein M3O02_03475 [Acidobacteriota bacterium]|nr:hypothetical protein [Acidobacteriota bacterium]